MYKEPSNAVAAIEVKLAGMYTEPRLVQSAKARGAMKATLGTLTSQSSLQFSKAALAMNWTDSGRVIASRFEFASAASPMKVTVFGRITEATGRVCCSTQVPGRSGLSERL